MGRGSRLDRYYYRSFTSASVNLDRNDEDGSLFERRKADMRRCCRTQGMSLLTGVFLNEHQLDCCRSEGVFRILVYKGDELLNQGQG